jgi:hypothetical protein
MLKVLAGALIASVVLLLMAALTGLALIIIHLFSLTGIQVPFLLGLWLAVISLICLASI